MDDATGMLQMVKCLLIHVHRCGASGAPGAENGYSGLVGEVPAVGVERTIHYREEPRARVGVVNQGSEDESVAILGLLGDLVGDVVYDAFSESRHLPHAMQSEIGLFPMNTVSVSIQSDSSVSATSLRARTVHPLFLELPFTSSTFTISLILTHHIISSFLVVSIVIVCKFNGAF